MKLFSPLLLAILLPLLSRGQRPIDVLHYRFEIVLSDSTDQIHGRALVKFKTLTDINTLKLDLTMEDEVSKKGMRVTSVTTEKVSLNFEQADQALLIRNEAGWKSETIIELQILYAGVPKDGLIISKNKYGHRTFFADNWPNRGHNWIPCVDDPGDKATVEFSVDAPRHYQVVANGIQIEETDYAVGRKRTVWKEDVPVATKVMVIGAADFAVGLAGIVEGIPVYSWVYPEDRNKGFYDYELATNILPYFIEKFGPYGYKKLANVQSKTMFGGLENANTIFYEENSVSGTRKSVSLLAHEIAHQWFGNMATEKSFAHLWLSEGFATYLTNLYMEHAFGKDTLISTLKKQRNEIIQFARNSNRPVVDDTSDYMALLNTNSYSKGGWILHMLHHELGEETFFKGIRAYYAKYAGSNADTRDLQAVLEKTAGKSLSTFFNQWLYTPGIPRLQVDWKYVTAKKQLQVTVKQLQTTAFEFPLDLGIQLQGTGAKVHKLTVKKSQETFIIPVSGAVRSVVLDPSTVLLFEGSVQESR